ncbi:PQQ-dependent sugar dehydrogenase [Pelagibacteraceae bacterium]|nr:PQQ-dependent sugar dehydrogenase [Pelagibacteraceae bacterium]
MLNLKKISVIILILALSINLLLDFSFITNRLGKEFREFAYQYLVPFKNIGNLENKIEKLENKNRQNLEATIHVDQKNIIDLEENIKNFNKEKILISGDRSIFVNAFNNLNDNLNSNLKKLEQNQITFNQIFKTIDPSEFDMMFKEQGKDLNYGYDGRFNIYDDNLSVKFYTPIGDTLLYGITNTTPGSGYLDIHDDNLILVSSSGVIGYSKKPLNKPKFGISLKQIQNNLNNFIDIEQFKKSRHFDDPKYSWLKGGWYSIKDVEIFDGDIYVSYTKEVKENCWNTSLLSGKMNYVYIHFTTLFTSEECVNEYDNIDDEYNAHQSGGRIINLNNETVLFSIGDFRSRYRSQMENSIFGKVIKFNKKNKNYKVISMGHRNPQGLFYNEKENFLLEAEHGPQGGDEINVIKLDNNTIQNFGWAISSYGEHYGGKNAPENKNKYEKYPLHKSHSEHGFIEPLKYFNPSIGISQIIGLGNENQYVVASLKAHSLYFFEYYYNNKENNFNIVKKLDIGERIRDMIYYNNKLYLFLEDTASLAEISFN